MFSHTGRGIWYIFLGTIALGGEWWAVLIAVFLMVLGAINVTAGCQNGSVNKDEDENENNDGQIDSNETKSGDWVNNNDVDVEINQNEVNKNENKNEQEKLEDDSGKKVNPFAEYEDY